MADLDTMTSNVMDYFGGRSDITSDMVAAQLNREMRRLGNAMDFYETEEFSTGIVTTPGVSSYLAPTDLFTLETLRDESNKLELIPKDIAWYSRQDVSSDVRGVPEYYVRRKDSLLVWPPPDGTYAYLMRYVERTASMTAGSDEPPFPEEWHEVIELMAASRLAFRKQLHTLGMTLKNEAEGMVEGLQEDPTADKRQRTSQVTFRRTRRKRYGEE